MIVDAPAGRFRGLEDGEVLRFRGIRYARAERFRPPEPVSAPAGTVVDAVAFGPSSPQLGSALEVMLGSEGEQSSEDCLFLNITTPAADDQRRPVMVWIHGGAFTSGSGAVPWYDGGHLSRAGDVVVVTINYRLGGLGYLHLEPLLGAGYGTAGNSGTLDQLAAIAWVRANIEAFGGDPQRITLFGESAGAMSIGTLISLPGVASGLHAAILQSGTGDIAATPAQAAGTTELLLQNLELSASQAELLLTVPVDRFLAAQRATAAAVAASATERRLAFRPVIDGVVVPVAPGEALRAGIAAGLPVIVGSTTEEWRLFGMWERNTLTLTDDDLRDRLTRVLGHPDEAVTALATYRAALPDANPHDVWSAVATDWWFRIPAVRLAEAQAAAGPQAWVYEFGYPSSAYDGVLGACHALDVPFAFGDLERPGVELFMGPIGPPARALAETMSRAWLAMAHGSSPEHEGMPRWPRYDPEAARAVLHLDGHCHVVEDPLAAERQVWTGHI